MAVKVSGTTVIDDSRNLVNITGVKTVSGTSILGTGDISFTVGINVGSVQYTGYTGYVAYNSYVQLLAYLPQPPSNGGVCDYDFVISGSSHAVRTKYRSLSN